MAVPSYTTDLTTLANADINTDTGTWGELTNHTGGAAATDEQDYFIQGSQCVSQSLGTKTGTQAGLQYNHGATVTLGTGDCIFVWQVLLAGNAIDTFANGGLRLYLGSSSGNVKIFKSSGSDFNRNPYGGWLNVAIDPTNTGDFTNEGSPSGTDWRLVGSGPNLTAAVSKGNMHALDKIQYGRGEVIIEHGETGNYGTFAGIATQNDNTSNRWGLFSLQGGIYIWKGLLSFGNTTNLCDFRDSNRVIRIDQTPKTYAAFNKIEINNASSNIEWTNVTILSPTVVPSGESSILSKGQLEVVDNATVVFNSCSFADMSTFIFKSNSTINGCVFRKCGLVTANSANLSNSSFINSTSSSSVLWNTAVDTNGKLDNIIFESDGSNHGIEITSFPVGDEITITGPTFTGYAATDGSTGNESIYVNIASGTYTINVTSSVGNVSLRTAGATVNLVVDPVTIKLTAVDSIGDPIQNAYSILKARNANGPLPYNVDIAITTSGSTATVQHESHGMITGDKVLIKGSGNAALDGVQTITVVNTNEYTYSI